LGIARTNKEKEFEVNRLHQYTIVRKFGIDSGHRVVGHEGKCASCHGHRYLFEIHAQPEEGLDEIGRVIDFSQIKEIVGVWLDSQWDHSMILWEKDPIAKLWSNHCLDDEGWREGEGPLFGHKIFLLPNNPTAENLASYLLTKSNELLNKNGIIITKVVCHETPNCSAEVSL
jgi:6-pyruvoyltetrahydropterin/6-carboxytetrahydropterin synthase